MQSIQAPDTCPSCHTDLEWVNHVLYCRNSFCEAKIEKRLEHFAKTLKIKGLGPVSIRKLDLQSIDELYQVKQSQIAESLNSNRLAEKLFAEIQRSKKAPLNKLLPALSIPLIGNTVAEKLSKVCNHINDINQDSCHKAGLGPKATESLIDWLVLEYPFYKDMPFSFCFEKRLLAKGVVCISGKLTSFSTKAEATKALNACGYEVKSTVTKDVTILINESGIESTKTKKARQSGIEIITNLKTILEN